jgi:hypothetical protein
LQLPQTCAREKLDRALPHPRTLLIATYCLQVIYVIYIAPRMATISIVQEKKLAKGQDSVDDIDVGRLRPITGCLCGIQSLYLDWPACLGCVAHQECLCLKGQLKACKISKEVGQCCILIEQKYVLKKPETCIQAQQQCFCVDQRCALPCTDEVPCIFNILGLTCCMQKKCKVKCCATLSDIDPNYSHTETVTLQTTVHQQPMVVVQQVSQPYVVQGAPAEMKAER